MSQGPGSSRSPSAEPFGGSSSIISTATDRAGTRRSQQTLAHYEVGRVGVAAAMLPRLAELLDLSFDEILTGHPTVRLPGKRGPASRLEQQLDAITRLPKAEQRAVSTLLTAVLAQHGAQIGQEAATA